MAFTRRSFIEKLSLGTGAALLSSLAEGLVREAYGQPSTRQRVVFVVSSNGWNSKCLPTRDDRVFKETSSFNLPVGLAPLAKYKSRMLLTDGLTNTYGGDDEVHRGAYSTLSGRTGWREPGGQTFDQYLASTLGKDAAFNWVGLAGVDVQFKPSEPPATLYDPWLSGSSRGKPVLFRTRPQDAFDQLFGGGSGSSAMDNTPDEVRLASLRKKSVFDFMLNDIKKTENALGGLERRKLEEYLASIRALESRRGKQLDDQLTNPMTCDADAAGTLSSATLEDGIEGHFKVATLALVCGLTQVVTISPGLFWMYYRKIFDKPSKAHSWGHASDESWGIEAYNKVHAHLATQISGMADGLSAAKEGDKSILDNTTIVWLNDAGTEHHSKHGRQPAVILGGAGGKLRTDGRYLAFPSRGDPRPDKAHSLADLYITMSHALGVPNNDFGKGSDALQPIKGLISELV